MNLVAETKAFVGWLKRVLGAFMAVRFWTTLTLIQALTTRNFANLLASFLPLKVILLAGSDGVPRYFQFLIPEGADKIPWIIGLTAAAVAFFILGLILEAVGRRLAATGSFEVLQGANEMAVSHQHREEIGSYFSQFSDIAANGLVLALSLVLLAIVNLTVFYTLLGLMLVEYLITLGVLAFGNHYRPGTVLRNLKNKPRNYLAFFSSINFLACFFVLLTPFLTGEGGNLILAILSILLMNQANGAVNGIIRPGLKLWRKRPGIDPLIFRDEKALSAENPTLRELRQVFDPDKHNAKIARQLATANLKGTHVSSHWIDPTIRGVYRFHLQIRKRADGEPVQQLQEQVFAPRQFPMLEHEQFLFEKISRSSVHAPEVVCRYSDGPFECQVCEYGSGNPLSRKQFKRFASSLLGELWCLDLPPELQAAYKTSNPSLAARLTPEFLERVSVTLDTAPDLKIHHSFLDRLPLIRELLESVPLYLHNPDLTATGTVWTEDRTPLVMSWIRWSLLPIGTHWPTEGPERCSELLHQACRARKISVDRLTLHHLELVNHCHHLAVSIDREHYRAALALMQKVLENELITPNRFH